MARLTEDIIKGLLRKEGFYIDDFYVASSLENIKTITEKLEFPVVLKALVPIGKKGKAGGVLFANNSEEAVDKAKNLFSKPIRNYRVEKILLERKIKIKSELYLSITYDRVKQLPLLIVSCKGGVDIEEAEEIYQHTIDPYLGLNPFEARSLWIKAGVKGELIEKLGMLTYQCYNFFTKYDAYLFELNPLAISVDNEIKIIGTLLGIDDAAIFRQKELINSIQIGSERYWRALTEREKEAILVNEADPYRGTARYTEMPGGDIGFMCGGGGASLLLFDALVAAGGKPANYSEFGGNPTAEKVYGLCKIILSKPGVKGLLVAQNITNNTQVDLVAEGVIKAIKELKIDTNKFPIVVREAGVNEKKARALFTQENIEYYSDEITLVEAAKMIVDKMKGI